MLGLVSPSFIFVKIVKIRHIKALVVGVLKQIFGVYKLAMTDRGRTRSETRRSAEEEEEAGLPPILEPKNRNAGTIHSPHSENVRYFIIPVTRTFNDVRSGAISKHEFVRHIRSAWSETPCSNNIKFNMIVDNVIDRNRQLLRLYTPSDNPDEMLAAILKLEGGECSQILVTGFYNMRQGAHESTDTCLLKLYKMYEQVVKAQENDGDIHMNKAILKNQLSPQSVNKV